MVVVMLMGCWEVDFCVESVGWVNNKLVRRSSVCRFFIFEVFSLKVECGLGVWGRFICELKDYFIVRNYFVVCRFDSN